MAYRTPREVRQVLEMLSEKKHTVVEIAQHFKRSPHFIRTIALENNVPLPESLVRWTADDVKLLTAEWKAGIPTEVIAKQLKRTPSAVTEKAFSLGFHRKHPRSSKIDRPHVYVKEAVEPEEKVGITLVRSVKTRDTFSFERKAREPF